LLSGNFLTSVIELCTDATDGTFSMENIYADENSSTHVTCPEISHLKCSPVPSLQPNHPRIPQQLSDRVFLGLSCICF